MVSWLENRLSINTREWTSVARCFGVPVRRDPILQVGIAGLVGLFLGLYVLVFRSLPSKLALLSLPIILAPFVVMVFGQLRKLLLAVILLDIPLQLDSYLSYRDSTIGGATDGLIVSITTLALIGLYALWLAEFLVKPRETQSRPIFWLVLPLAVYLAIVIISVIVAKDTQLSVFRIFLLGQMFLLYVYLVGTVQTRKDISFIVMMLLVGLALESLIMIGLRVVGHGIEVGGVLNARIDDGVRVGGTVGGPNTASGYTSLLLTPALAFVLTNPRRVYKALAILAFGLGATALFLTLSRSGWIAWSVSVVVFCFFVWRRGWMPVTIPIIIGIVGTLLTFLLGNEIVGRLFGDDNGSATSRIPLMKVAFKMISANPLLGVGTNNFTVRLLEYAKLNHVDLWLYAVHNKYLLVWGETGTVGLLAFLWFLSSTLYRGWQCWLFKDRQLSLLALGFATAILGHMIALNFDTFQNRASIQTLWVCAALVAAMYNTARNDILTGRKLYEYNI